MAIAVLQCVARRTVNLGRCCRKSRRPGRAEQLVDVALAITDMDASSGMSEKLSGLLDILQPPDAFLLLDWDARRIDLLLERGGSLEFLPGPEFDRRQSEWQPLSRHDKAGVHEDATNRVRSQAACLVTPAVDALGDADRVCVLALIAELGRVVEHKNRTFDTDGTLTR